METFKDEYFMSPEDYKAFVVNLATSSIVIESKTPSNIITPFATGSATKYANISFGNSQRQIAVTGAFTIDHILGRMGFAGIKSMTPQAKDARGTWTQRGYNGKIIDAGETMDVSVSGIYSENGSSKNYDFSLEFYCSGTGSIS